MEKDDSSNPPSSSGGAEIRGMKKFPRFLRSAVERVRNLLRSQSCTPEARALANIGTQLLNAMVAVSDVDPAITLSITIGQIVINNREQLMKVFWNWWEDVKSFLKDLMQRPEEMGASGSSTDNLESFNKFLEDLTTAVDDLEEALQEVDKDE